MAQTQTNTAYSLENFKKLFKNSEGRKMLSDEDFEKVEEATRITTNTPVFNVDSSDISYV